jgi:hypothetical protein
MSALAYELIQGHWVYINHKVYHPGWVLSLQLRTVIEYSEKGHISEAINQHKEYYEKVAREMFKP